MTCFGDDGTSDNNRDYLGYREWYLYQPSSVSSYRTSGKVGL